MSIQVGSEVLEEGEIEDEEEENGSNHDSSKNGGRSNTESGRTSPKTYTDRRRRHSFGISTPSPSNVWENVPGQRSHEQVLPPLTRGGYWAPPPLGPPPTLSGSHEQSPGSRVFKYLKNRTKSAEHDSKEIQNRRPVLDRCILV